MQRDDTYLLDILIAPDPVNAETQRAQRTQRKSKNRKRSVSLHLCTSALK
jgi:hypothetical protein